MDSNEKYPEMRNLTAVDRQYIFDAFVLMSPTTPATAPNSLWTKDDPNERTRACEA